MGGGSLHFLGAVVWRSRRTDPMMKSSPIRFMRLYHLASGAAALLLQQEFAMDFAKTNMGDGVRRKNSRF
jgi:hypothetical protein